MDRALFFQAIRTEPFSGHMTQSQVDGLNDLLDAWATSSITLSQMAYVLATVFHETGARMQPVREGFKASDKEARAYVKRQGYKYAEPDPDTGQVYYGRGHVQLTWAKNYQAMAHRLGVPLYENPDMALMPEHSIRILFDGMEHGFFTGKALRDYFHNGYNDALGARRIINGTDRAALVAGYYEAFLKALRAAQGGVAVVEPETDRITPAPRYPEQLKPLGQSRTIIGSGIAGASTIGGAVVDRLKADDAQQAVQQAQDAVSYTMGIWTWASIAMAALGLLGVALVIYSKLHRRREGME